MPPPPPPATGPFANNICQPSATAAVRPLSATVHQQPSTAPEQPPSATTAVHLQTPSTTTAVHQQSPSATADDDSTLDDTYLSDEFPASVEVVETTSSSGILESSRIMAIKKGSCSQNFASRLNAELFDVETRKKSNIAGSDKLKLTGGVHQKHSISIWPLTAEEGTREMEWRACCIAIDEKNRRLNNKPLKQKQQNT